MAKLVGGEVVEKYLWQNKTTLLATYDGNGELKQRFEYTLGHAPTAFTQNGERYYLLTDQLGSPRIVTNSTGSVVKDIRYDSYGNVLEDSNPEFELLFGFAGGLYDNDTGLLRFGYRDFDPETGRWTARDPIGFAGGDTNLYGYVLGDPLNLVDPEGLNPAPLVAIVVYVCGKQVIKWISRTALKKALGPTYRKADSKHLENILTSYYGKEKTGDRIGNGGLGDALRYEKSTGDLLSPSGHRDKAIEVKKRLEKFIKNAENQPPGSYPNSKKDVDFARELVGDLNNALDS